jgi:hypothetical protein
MATNPYPGVVIGGGGAGSVTAPITISGAGSGYTYSTASSTTATSKIKLEGADSDILVQGKSMKAWMETVERRLSILEPKPELLEKYEALQNAYDTYKTLESLLYEQE